MTREIPLVMPKMSMTMETGELIEWTKSVGDEVDSGDVVAVVQTDKVDMEVESPVGGTLVRTVAEPGDVVGVGKPLAFIATEAEDLMGGLLDDPEPPAGDQTGSGAPAPAVFANSGPTTVASGAEAPLATPPSRRGPQPAVPFARRRAAELHVRLADVVGSGPNGLITVTDVERRAEHLANRLASHRDGSSAPAAVDQSATAVTAASTFPGHTATAPNTQQVSAANSYETEPASPGFADALAPRRRSVRSAVARAMTGSTVVPQFTVFADLDLEDLARVRNGIGWTTLLIRGLARALRSEPAVLAGWNSAADAPASVPESCGVALATDTPVGLLAPVVRDPDLLPVRELDGAVRETIDRARGGRLKLEDMQGASTTLSNLGNFNVPSFTSLLTPPQASALSVGSISQRPVVRQSGLTVRLGVTVGLTVDHRAVDGADAARVLNVLRNLCDQPERLLD